MNMYPDLQIIKTKCSPVTINRWPTEPFNKKKMASYKHLPYFDKTLATDKVPEDWLTFQQCDQITSYMYTVYSWAIIYVEISIFSLSWFHLWAIVIDKERENDSERETVWLQAADVD